jgi:transposase
LCKLAERQMLRASFVPPVEVRRLRDLTRYRVDLVIAQSSEKNRVEKLLEDAQIKLSVVASDIFGVSGRAMLAALIAGQRDPVELAQLAKAGLRRKLDDLREALTGHFDQHHAFLLAKMLSRIDAIQADIDDVDAQIEVHIAPFATAAARLEQIPGIGRVAARAIIAEIGLDMTRFPTAAHLSSLARFAPKVKESAGRRKGTGATGHGNPYLARTLGNIAASAGRTQTFLGERYRRIRRRRGPQRAIVAIGRSVLVIVWHMLSDPETAFQDLGVTFYDTRINPERRARHHIHQLEALGYDVTATRPLPTAA